MEISARAEILDGLIEAILSHNASGGHMHLVLGEDNIDDSSIRCCIEQLIPDERDGLWRDTYMLCAKILLSLSLEQRRFYFDHGSGAMGIFE